MAAPTARRRVMVVGSGTRFLSGISYYTHRLAASMATRDIVSVLLMRRLLPRFLYPGKARVGQNQVNFRYPAGVRLLDGMDWFWGWSALRAARFVRQERPQVLILQWWTGTVLHSYVLLAVLARRRGAKVVLEVHEAQDVGELGIPLADRYVHRLFPVLMRLCSAVVVHSSFDRALVEEHFGVHGKPVVIVPHGPYWLPELESVPERSGQPVCRLLYFGVIRPFKGVEDLLEAFSMLTPEAAAGYHLTVVGETWEGWNLPGELIAAHPHRAHITFVNRYVDDDEVSELFSRADGVVLPYHRSSSSGPLLIAIGNGLPVIVTAVGGLVEAAERYEGALFVPPRDPAAICDALPRLALLAGTRYATTTTWEDTVERYAALIDSLVLED